MPGEVAQIHRESARSAVLRLLRGWIEEGVLRPGEPLRDFEIATRLGVSRTPVREAIFALERLGAVVSAPGRHVQVVPARLEDLSDVVVPYAALHGALVADVAGVLDDSDLATLDDLVKQLRGGVEAGDTTGASEADAAFHNLLEERSGNTFLLDALDVLTFHRRRLRALFEPARVPGVESWVEHQRIMDALRRRDVGAARDATRDHFETVATRRDRIARH